MADIAEALARLRPEPPLWVFDDGTGAPVDAPPLPQHAGHLPVAAASVAPPPGAGRPRLGVVAREVTLLPRHWDWLAAQPAVVRRFAVLIRLRRTVPVVLRRVGARLSIALKGRAGHDDGRSRPILVR